MGSVISLMAQSFLSYLVTYLVAITIGAVVDKILDTHTYVHHRIGVIIATLCIIGMCIETIIGKTSMPSRDFAQGSIQFEIIGWVLIIIYILAATSALFIGYIVLHCKDAGTRQLLSRIFSHHPRNTRQFPNNQMNANQHPSADDKNLDREIKDRLKHM